jgi:hypothetical protein
MRPRWVFPSASSSSFREISIYSSLRAYYPTKPFYPFRHPQTFRMAQQYVLYAPPSITVSAFYGIEESLWSTLNARVRARLTLCHDCFCDEENEPPPMIRHLLYEVAYQQFPLLIHAIQCPDPAKRRFMIPHDHICYTRDVLPELPIGITGSFMTKIKSMINGVKMDRVFHMLMWAMVNKTFTRTHAIRNIIKIMVNSVYEHRVLVDLNIDVTMLYGFLGAYPSANVRPTMPVAMAVMASFQHLASLSLVQYRAFVFQYFHMIFFSWSMYCIDHVENMPVLNALLHLFPSRQIYVDDVRLTLDRCRALLNKHLEPVALDIIRDPTHPTEAVRAAWTAFMIEGNNLYEAYRAVRSKRYIIRPCEPPCSTISINVRTELRNAARLGQLPPDCQPTATRTPRGCHPVLSQDELRALYIVAVLNMSIAVYPIVEFMHIFRVKQELIDKIRRSITKFCCRGGKKHAFVKYTKKWIAIDPRGTMFFQQYLEFCASISNIYLVQLPLNVRNNQEHALRRRFQIHGENMDETFGRFYYCIGCENKLSLTVLHPQANRVMFHSIHSVQNIAEPTQYEAVDIYNNRCGYEVTENILKQIQRVGATTRRQVPAMNLHGDIICSGKKRHQEKETSSGSSTHNSWCNLPISHVNLIGGIFYLNNNAYTICVVCGAFCNYLPNFFTSEGPVCTVHRPMMASFYYEQYFYSIKDNTLNQFLNQDYRPALVWMCEIDACRRRCNESIKDVVGIDAHGRIRFIRICDSHHRTLSIMLHGYSGIFNRAAGSYDILSIPLIQRMLQRYGEGDIRKLRFNMVGTKTECYQIKKK